MKVKFYAVIFGDRLSFSDMDVVDVFYNEADAEKDVERRYNNGECDGVEEWFEVHEWDEKKVAKYWGELPIS